jgi:hypothetical protein
MDQKIICNIDQYVYRLIPLDNNDLLILLEKKILCLKSPTYSLNNPLVITFDNSKIDGICLWKNNHVIIKTPEKFIVIEIFDNNNNFRIISEQNILENLYLRYQKMISLNNCTKILLNTMKKFIIMEEYNPNLFQVKLHFSYHLGFNSFIQIKPDEIVSNSSDEKMVYFIDIKKGKIIEKIENIQVYIEDVDSFCFVSDDIIAMGGDLRDGIYLFDINQRKKIYHYKGDYIGFHSLLYLGNNKFLGEAYGGRVYGESDDESEELYSTIFFEFKKEKNKIKKYKTGESRIYALKRSNYIKFNNLNKIAYYANKSVFIENI